jgi:phenylalanyl-tRNA synthetase beta chain
VPAHNVERALRGASPLVTDVALFDVFRSDAVGGDRRSVAYAVRLQSGERTLTDADVAEARAALIAAAESTGAELRT